MDTAVQLIHLTSCLQKLLEEDRHGIGLCLGGDLKEKYENLVSGEQETAAELRNVLITFA